MHRIFISYRRADTAREAHVLKTLLEARVRDAAVFIDTDDITPATRWPRRLAAELGRAAATIVLVGPDWRCRSDGVDRLLAPDDWVRREVEAALARPPGTVLPVIVEDSADQLRDLPPSLEPLAEIQGLPLTSERFVDDVRRIASWVGGVLGADEGHVGRSYPRPDQIKQLFSALRPAEIDRLLQSGGLGGWTVRGSVIDDDATADGLELFKTFEFTGFRRAFNFMQSVAILAERYNHHPDWSNVWNRVSVRQRTWDAGHVLTPLDFQLAAAMNHAAERCSARPAEMWPPRDPAAD